MAAGGGPLALWAPRPRPLLSWVVTLEAERSELTELEELERDRVLLAGTSSRAIWIGSLHLKDKSLGALIGQSSGLSLQVAAVGQSQLERASLNATFVFFISRGLGGVLAVILWRVALAVSGLQNEGLGLSHSTQVVLQAVGAGRQFCRIERQGRDNHGDEQRRIVFLLCVAVRQDLQTSSCSRSGEGLGDGRRRREVTGGKGRNGFIIGVAV
ncbi:hypothetical protein EYF80_008108 [Liparis tanakae]|uniref:Uncharacterized protein n=1 Tax=Liparis tanakae TaxID=230148 RepID=A0A4Z2IWK2_9TELE|nr:hypothetical protein EYF80_008108 [Liparis tanakae]